MSRRIDIELTSARDDGSWTWRAAGAREPKGTVSSAMLPPGAAGGHVLRVEIEGNLDGLDVVAVVPPKAARSGPERLEFKPAHADQPLVTSTLEPRRSGERARLEVGGGRIGLEEVFARASAFAGLADVETENQQCWRGGGGSA